MTDQLTGVVIGGIIGIAGSILGPILNAWYQRRAERESLRRVFAGEISAMLHVAEQRHYLEGLREILALARKSGNPDSTYFYYFSVRRNPFPVYDANLTRLGLLDARLAGIIARFYGQAASILEDIADFREGRSPTNRDDSIRRLEELLVLAEDTQRLGREILGQIN